MKDINLIKLRCDIVNTKSIWFRVNRKAATLELFILKQPKVKRHYELKLGLWFFGFRLSVNPFLKHTLIETGKRFSSIPFVRFQILKSSTTL